MDLLAGTKSVCEDVGSECGFVAGLVSGNVLGMLLVHGTLNESGTDLEPLAGLEAGMV
jgi:hypothetical protein